MTAQGPRTADAESEGTSVVDARALGERLGRYQLVMPLAQGGMGLVFAGRLLGAHGVERLVAIKTLRPITSTSDRAALLREARLTSRLHHRNIVATLDLGEVDDVPYVVMELVDGVAFSRLLGELATRREPLGVELAGWIVMQAANGLHEAHELTDADGKPLHLVHRDVSPQNILLSTGGDVKIADFGIAKFADREESTATGMIKGKFGYMSPEQAGAGVLDRRSDIFALGIVLWEALANERLFSADTPARTIRRVLEHIPEPPVTFRPEVGSTLSDIVMRCLEKDPAKRFDTAALLAESLRAALRARPAVTDETDLGAIVRRLFGDERRAMMDRLKNEALADTTDTLSLAVAAPEGSGLVAVSLSTPEPRRARRAAAGAAFLLALGGVAWALAPPTKPDATNTDRGPAPAATLLPVLSATASSVLAALPPAAVDSPALASVAPPSPPPPAVADARPTPAAAPKPSANRARAHLPAAAARSAPAPAPTTPAGGQPFESL